MGVRPAVTVEIDVLAVEGFSEEQALALGDAVRLELTRLLESEGLPPGVRAGATASATLDGLTIAADRPAATGADLARAIYRGLAP